MSLVELNCLFIYIFFRFTCVVACLLYQFLKLTVLCVSDWNEINCKYVKFTCSYSSINKEYDLVSPRKWDNGIDWKHIRYVSSFALPITFIHSYSPVGRFQIKRCFCLQIQFIWNFFFMFVYCVQHLFRFLFNFIFIFNC